MTQPLSLRASKVLIWVLALVWFPVFMFVTWRLGIQHDYIYYLAHWQLTIGGGDPWVVMAGEPPNTYGPIYALIGFSSSLGELLPKLLMSGLFGISVVVLAVGLAKRDVSRTAWLLFFLVVIINPLVWIAVAAYGDNDALVAALVIAAALARYSSRQGMSGAFLALATLTKYYPALLLPTFAFGIGRSRRRLVLVFLGIVGGGLLATYLIWGGDFLSSLLFGGERDATMLSFLYSWSQVDGAPGAGIRNILVEWNTVIVLASWALVTWIALRLKLSWAEASVVVTITFLATYKVGHTQFYLVLCALCATLLLQGDTRSRSLVVMSLPLLGLVAMYQITYFLRTSGVAVGFPDATSFIGFVATPLAIATVALSLWVLHPDRWQTTPAMTS